MARNRKRTAKPGKAAADESPFDHPRGPLIGATMAGVVLMRDPERVRQLARAGWFQSEGSRAGHKGAAYRLLDIVHGYIRFRDDEGRRGTKTAAASRIAEARSREVELRNAYREGHLIELEEALETVEAIMGVLRLNLSGLPARVTRDLQLRRTIETAINDILDSLADIAAEKSKALGKVRASSAPIAADDTGQVGGRESNASANVRSARATRPALDPVHN